jgi:hypothetical protein
MFDAAADHDAPRDLERYLADERRAAARRLLRIGVAALLFGTLGTIPLVRGWIEGGPIPNIAFAAPLLLVLGGLLTRYAVAASR